MRGVYFVHAFRLCVISFVCVASASVVHADAPIVTSFSASPSVIGFGIITTLNWSLANGAGAGLYFTCPAGITITKDSGAFPCNSDADMGSLSSDTAAFKITNVSGSTQSISARLTPKDLNGALASGASVLTSITVTSVPQPILDVTVLPISVSSGAVATVVWTGNGIANANVQFTCVSGIKIYSSENDLLPCGSPAYTTALAGSGSVTVKSISTNSSATEVQALVFPGIGDGTYDATHALSKTFVVLPQDASPQARVTAFSSSRQSLASGNPISFSWSAANASSTNILFQCDSSISFIAEPTTTPVSACGAPAFLTPLTDSGTITLIFTSRSNSSVQYIWASMLIKNPDGSYDSTRGKSLMFTLYPTGALPQYALSVPQQTNIPVSASSSRAFVHAGTLSVGLGKNSKHPQVKILQALLAQDPTLYPEGSVTGFLGTLTDAAVKKFQERYGLARPGESGYGFVGLGFKNEVRIF